MFDVEGGEEEFGLGQQRTLDVPGIFDMRWLPSEPSPPTLALACADGTVSLVGSGHAGGQGLESLACEVCFQNSMAASVALNCGQRGNDSAQKLAASSSAGELALLQVCQPQAASRHCISAHSSCMHSGMYVWSAKLKLQASIVYLHVRHTYIVACMSGLPSSSCKQAMYIFTSVVHP